VFKENNLSCEKSKLTINLADGTESLVNCLITQVLIEIAGKEVLTYFVIYQKPPVIELSSEQIS